MHIRTVFTVSTYAKTSQKKIIVDIVAAKMLGVSSCIATHSSMADTRFGILYDHVIIFMPAPSAWMPRGLHCPALHYVTLQNGDHSSAKFEVA
jgi:hypothetical protein